MILRIFCFFYKTKSVVRNHFSSNDIRNIQLYMLVIQWFTNFTAFYSKHDFSIENLVSNHFWTTEPCGNSKVMAYKLHVAVSPCTDQPHEKAVSKNHALWTHISTCTCPGKTKDKHILYFWSIENTKVLPANMGKSIMS